jgi:hypothetical protein
MTASSRRILGGNPVSSRRNDSYDEPLPTIDDAVLVLGGGVEEKSFEETMMERNRVRLFGCFCVCFG